jgi:hypothetical protein
MLDLSQHSIDPTTIKIHVPERMFTFEKKEIEQSSITFHTQHSEMLKITPDGFYVRGIKVPADDQEAESVYRAFKEFLIWSALTRN